MTSNTVLLVLHVKPNLMKDPAFDDDLLKIGNICIGEVASRQDVSIGNGDRVITIVGKDTSHVNMRVYANQGYITIDIYYLNEGKNSIDMNYIYQNLEKKIRDYLGEKCEGFNSIQCPIRRGGQSIWRYFSTGDERLWEADYDEMVFEKDSEWQNIRIYHSIENGHVLHLDYDIMYSENDLIYMDTLLGLGSEKRMDYANKEVLILGGGDGGLIHLLKQQDPKMVTMCEIDVEVIKACRTHMRGACGDSMDEFIGPNHQIVLRDCMEVLLEDSEAGKKYDVVVNDLTEFPVDKALKGYCYDFETTSRIMELSLRVLKPGGRFLARGNCRSAYEYHKRFLLDVEKLGAKCIRRDRQVPSFGEIYAHYEVWIPQTETNNTI